MQIRIKDNRIQLLRSFYDRSKKRSRQKMIASLKITGPEDCELPAGLKLTAEEQEQLTAYLIALSERSRKEELGQALASAPSMLGRVAQAITELGCPPGSAQDVYQGIRAVEQALRGQHKVRKPPRQGRAQKDLPFADEEQ